MRRFQENVYHASVLHYGRYQLCHSYLSAGNDNNDGWHDYGESPDGRGNYQIFGIAASKVRTDKKTDKYRYCKINQIDIAHTCQVH